MSGNKLPLTPVPGGDETTFRQWTGAVTDQLSSINNTLGNLANAQEEQTTHLKNIENMITGNGHPEEGMAFRLKLAEKDIDELRRWKQEQQDADSLKNRIIAIILGLLIPAAGTALWLGIKASLVANQVH